MAAMELEVLRGTREKFEAEAFTHTNVDRGTVYQDQSEFKRDEGWLLKSGVTKLWWFCQGSTASVQKCE